MHELQMQSNGMGIITVLFVIVHASMAWHTSTFLLVAVTNNFYTLIGTEYFSIEIKLLNPTKAIMVIQKSLAHRYTLCIFV